MHDFTRRSLLQGGTALATVGALTGPALLEYAKAWAQTAPWQAEKGAKLTVMRWKRFVPAEDDAFNAMVAAFGKATGTEMNVFSESFEDVQPKASVAANTGSGLDMAWGLHRCRHKNLQAGQRLARHSRRHHRRLHDLPQVGGRQGRLQGIPEGLPGLPRHVQGAEGEQHAGRLCAGPCER